MNQLDAWNLLLTYLPWIIAAFFVLMIFIVAYLASIASALKDIADRFALFTAIRAKEPEQS